MTPQKFVEKWNKDYKSKNQEFREKLDKLSLTEDEKKLMVINILFQTALEAFAKAQRKICMQVWNQCGETDDIGQKLLNAPMP